MSYQKMSAKINRLTSEIGILRKQFKYIRGTGLLIEDIRVALHCRSLYQENISSLLKKYINFILKQQLP